tara:strand:- start:28 stop:462 length:435 start_codon:yes stop_codon:yes gene_type:complete
MTHFIFATYALVDMIDGLFDDEGNFEQDTLMGLHYDLKTAQEFAQGLPGYNRVYAILDNNDQGGPLLPDHGLDVTDADSLPQIYDDTLLSSLKESLPLCPDLPSEFRHVDASLLPLFGFCAGRPVKVNKDRTGYLKKPRPKTTT